MVIYPFEYLPPLRDFSCVPHGAKTVYVEEFLLRRFDMDDNCIKTTTPISYKIFVDKI